jgi:hypothetical protein
VREWCHAAFGCESVRQSRVLCSYSRHIFFFSIHYLDVHNVAFSPAQHTIYVFIYFIIFRYWVKPCAQAHPNVSLSRDPIQPTEYPKS